MSSPASCPKVLQKILKITVSKNHEAAKIEIKLIPEKLWLPHPWKCPR